MVHYIHSGNFYASIFYICFHILYLALINKKHNSKNCLIFRIQIVHYSAVLERCICQFFVRVRAEYGMRKNRKVKIV